jgi:hypothetical protein
MDSFVLQHPIICTEINVVSFNSGGQYKNFYLLKPVCYKKMIYEHVKSNKHSCKHIRELL